MDTKQITNGLSSGVSNKRTLILVLAVIVIIALGVGGYVYWKRSVAPIEQAPDLSGSTVEEVLPELNTSANPYENVSETNPVKKANPFTDVKTNPFE